MFKKILSDSYFIRSFLIRSMGSMGQLGLVVLSGILTARFLGPEGKGTYTLLYTFLNLLLSLGCLSLFYGQVFLKKTLSIHQIYSSTFIVSVFNTCVCGLIAFLAVGYIQERFFPDVSVGLVYAVLFCSSLLSFARNIKSVIESDSDMFYSTLIFISRPILFLISFFSLSILFEKSVKFAAYSIIISILGMLLVGGVIVIFKGYKLNVRGQGEIVRKLMAFSVKTHFGNLLKFVQYRFDIILVGYFLNAKEAGFYSVAMMFAELLWRVPNICQTVLLPRLAGMEDRKAILTTVRMNRIVFWFTMFCLVFLLFTAKFFIGIAFGDEFLPAYSATLLMFPGVLSFCVWKILMSKVIMNGDLKTYNISMGLSAVVMLGLDLLLIPGFGIEGAAIAASAAYSLSAIYVFIRVYRDNDVRFFEYFNIFEELRMIRVKVGK